MAFPSNHGIVRALDQKRRMLDLEIERFKAMKEDEYRRFEEQLRSPLKEEGDFDSWNTEHLEYNDDQLSSKRTNTYTTERRSNPYSRRDSIFSQSDPPLTPLTPLRPSHSPSPTLPKDISHTETTTQGGTPQNRANSPQAIRTPSYLPLLDTPARSPRATINRPPTSIDDHLSSSATLSSTAFSPPGSPSRCTPISSSEPRPDVLHIRRSSSRSDVSLRSIMRSPKSPKSPKHVLFSIDNVVMSPSTSPEIAKKHRQSSKKEGKKRRHSTGSRPIENLGAEAAIGSRAGRSLVPQTPNVISYQDLMHTKPVSKSIGKDIGLEKKQNDVESDDALFPFDEDLTADQENGLEDRRRRKGKEKMKETDKEADDPSTDDVKGKPLAKGSPHAGSLPIQIKWPQRKDPRTL